MGIGTKLNFAFMAVVVVMVGCYATYALFRTFTESRSEAKTNLETVKEDVPEVLKSIAGENQEWAGFLAKNPEFNADIQAKNRDKIAGALQASAQDYGITGSVSIIGKDGKVFFSTANPKKFGYPATDSTGCIDSALATMQDKKCYTAFGLEGIVSITAMVPLSPAQGLVAVSQPLNTELLTGLVARYESLAEPDRISDMEMILFDVPHNTVTAFTPGLSGKDGGFVEKLNKDGLKVLGDLKKNSVEAGGRMWMFYPLKKDDESPVGVLLFSQPLPDIIPQVIHIVIQSAIAGAVAIVIGFFIATIISGTVNQSLRFLIQRAKDLGAQKRDLAPLDGLDGEWLELGELMDTSVQSMRSSMQSLKSHASQHSVEMQDALKKAEEATNQLAGLNRQLSEKSRQLQEISKQVNFSNQQSVALQYKLDSVLQISSEGFLMLDQYGNVLSANPVFLNWMGVKEGEIAGRRCFDLVQKPGTGRGGAPPAQTFGKHSGNPGDLINEFYPEGVIHHRTENKSIEVLAHLQPIVSDNQNIEGYVMVLRDKSLRSEVSQLRNEIVAMLTDSIRQPLVSVQPTWKSILRDEANTMHPSVGQSLAQLNSHYEQLVGLIDSLLMMYGGVVPTSAAPKESLVINRLVADCLEQVSGMARDHQLMLDYKTVTGLPEINADKETLQRIIIQVLEKMISITAPGGRVRVESALKDKLMRIGVTSSGPALPQEEIEEMFVGFIEGKHQEATYSTRLSMYLARNNIERLGGKIWSQSEQGRGTVIFFTLPVA